MTDQPEHPLIVEYRRACNLVGQVIAERDQKLDTAQERNAALEAALRALVEATHPIILNGYEKRYVVNCCEESRAPVAEERHAPDCPIVQAKNLLSET